MTFFYLEFNILSIYDENKKMYDRIEENFGWPWEFRNPQKTDMPYFASVETNTSFVLSNYSLDLKIVLGVRVMWITLYKISVCLVKSYIVRSRLRKSQDFQSDL